MTILFVVEKVGMIFEHAGTIRAFQEHFLVFMKSHVRCETFGMFKGKAAPCTLVRFQVRMCDHMTFQNSFFVRFKPANDARKFTVLFRHELFKFLFPKVGSDGAVGFHLFSFGGHMLAGHMLV